MSLQKTALKRLGNVANLFLNGDTKVIYQGFTGKQVPHLFDFELTRGDIECSRYHRIWDKSRGRSVTRKGRNSSRARPSCVQHGEGGSSPVMRSRADIKAKAHLNPHASAVFVPATLAAKAIEEAIENEIPLIVSVAEGMPAHDCLRVPISPRSRCFDRVDSRSTKCSVHNRNLGYSDPIVLES